MFKLFTLTTAVSADCTNPDTSKCGCEELSFSNYRGDIAVTTGGAKCRDWSKVKTDDHQEFIPDDTSGEDLSANYCRNPGMMEIKAWCYTVDDDIVWDYCDVPVCGNGGDVSSAESGSAKSGTVVASKKAPLLTKKTVGESAGSKRTFAGTVSSNLIRDVYMTRLVEEDGKYYFVTMDGDADSGGADPVPVVWAEETSGYECTAADMVVNTVGDVVLCMTGVKDDKTVTKVGLFEKGTYKGVWSTIIDAEDANVQNCVLAPYWGKDEAVMVGVFTERSNSKGSAIQFTNISNDGTEVNTVDAVTDIAQASGFQVVSAKGNRFAVAYKKNNDQNFIIDMMSKVDGKMVVAVDAAVVDVPTRSGESDLGDRVFDVSPVVEMDEFEAKKLDIVYVAEDNVTVNYIVCNIKESGKGNVACSEPIEMVKSEQGVTLPRVSRFTGGLLLAYTVEGGSQKAALFDLDGNPLGDAYPVGEERKGSDYYSKRMTPTASGRFVLLDGVYEDGTVFSYRLTGKSWCEVNFGEDELDISDMFGGKVDDVSISSAGRFTFDKDNKKIKFGGYQRPDTYKISGKSNGKEVLLNVQWPRCADGPEIPTSAPKPQLRQRN